MSKTDISISRAGRYDPTAASCGCLSWNPVSNEGNMQRLASAVRLGLVAPRRPTDSWLSALTCRASSIVAGREFLPLLQLPCFVIR